MLVLSRKHGQKVFIGKDQEIVIQIVDIDRNRVRIGITCDRAIPIYREESLPPDNAVPKIVPAVTVEQSVIIPVVTKDDERGRLLRKLDSCFCDDGGEPECLVCVETRKALAALAGE